MTYWTKFKHYCNDKYATQCHYLGCFQRMMNASDEVDGLLIGIIAMLAVITALFLLSGHAYATAVFAIFTLLSMYVLYYCWRYFV